MTKQGCSHRMKRPEAAGQVKKGLGARESSGIRELFSKVQAQAMSKEADPMTPLSY